MNKKLIYFLILFFLPFFNITPLQIAKAEGNEFRVSQISIMPTSACINRSNNFLINNEIYFNNITFDFGGNIYNTNSFSCSLHHEKLINTNIIIDRINSFTMDYACQFSCNGIPSNIRFTKVKFFVNIENKESQYIEFLNVNSKPTGLTFDINIKIDKI